MTEEPIMRDFAAFRKLVGLDDLRLERLRVAGEWLRPKVAEITDDFYERLLAEPTTAAFLDGKIEHLKKVHHAWIEDILSGVYDEPFFIRQINIGKAHVKNQIPPLFLASGFSILRILLFDQMEAAARNNPTEACPRCSRALGRLLDACQFLIDRSYEQDRLNRVSQATGMSLPLIEALVMLKPRQEA
ncbi:MAG: protoglobin domain-containing protein [Acidithiobacillus sp.]